MRNGWRRKSGEENDAHDGDENSDILRRGEDRGRLEAS